MMGHAGRAFSQRFGRIAIVRLDRTASNVSMLLTDACAPFRVCIAHVPLPIQNSQLGAGWH